jgi:tetratricopeptide (TPR) repeat protein
LYNAAAQSSHIAPGQQATLYLHAGTALEQLGRTEEARHTYELALSMASNQDDIDFIRGRIKVLGGGEATADDASAAAAEVAAGVIAYENGDAAGARTAFEAALHLDGTDAEKGRAQYYLGAMDYQAHQYANARNHVEAAAKNAPEPEKGWAQGMLQWRWDEHLAAPAAGAASPAAPGAPYSPTEI